MKVGKLREIKEREDIIEVGENTSIVINVDKIEIIKLSLIISYSRKEWVNFFFFGSKQNIEINCLFNLFSHLFHQKKTYISHLINILSFFISLPHTSYNNYIKYFIIIIVYEFYKEIFC